MSDAPDLSPRDAVDRWLDHARIDRADETIRGYWSRLKMFVEWCESDGVESVADLTPWDLERYETDRRGNDLAPTTLRNELVLLRMVFEWLEKKGLATDGLADSIELPNVSKTDQTSDTMLEPERAQQLLHAYRSGETEFLRGHAFLELAWFTGLRMGAIRGLDLADVDLDEGVIHVNHRPESDTPLKNSLDGERVVGISEPVVDALQRYIAQQRPTTRQPNGRRPLFATQQGRISSTALRTTSYYATLPCRGVVIMTMLRPRERFKYHAGDVEAKLRNQPREKDRIWTPVSFSPRTISVAPRGAARLSFGRRHRPAIAVSAHSRINVKQR